MVQLVPPDEEICDHSGEVNVEEYIVDVGDAEYVDTLISCAECGESL